MNCKVKSRIWIELDDKEFLGEGKVRLLKAIDQTGSLSKAAKSLGISYKKAWHLIDSVNNTAKKPVTVNSIGGKGGGGTKLTPYGKALVKAFEEMNLKCWDFLDIQLEKIKSL
ncbi:winged helix-turn-helix domain-containing protein [Salinimicrobium soli]|uniref:winged helix-turn-helix domain-containing protein n=1 Tax=Salinimicrobium soli TaxID=1254399 RepID=UPI003AAA9972